MADVLLRASGLTVGYADRTVLSAVHFELRAGERVVLLGPNGAGKSTLMATLGGVIPPLGGELKIQAQPLDQLAPQARAQRIAYVPQQEEPAFDFTVHDMVMLGRLPHRTAMFDTPNDEHLVQEALARVGAAQLAERGFRQCSGGERQRVLLARALAQDTPILMLDEPSSNLDLQAQGEMVQLLRDLGKAMVIALHDVNLALALADRAVLVGSGLVTEGDSMEGLIRSGRLSEHYAVPLMPVEEDGRIVGVIRPFESLTC